MFTVIKTTRTIELLFYFNIWMHKLPILFTAGDWIRIPAMFGVAESVVTEENTRFPRLSLFLRNQNNSSSTINNVGHFCPRFESITGNISAWMKPASFFFRPTCTEHQIKTIYRAKWAKYYMSLEWLIVRWQMARCKTKNKTKYSNNKKATRKRHLICLVCKFPYRFISSLAWQKCVPRLPQL